MYNDVYISINNTSININNIIKWSVLYIISLIYIYIYIYICTIGVYKNGTMLSLVIDGEEDILEGPDLFETAELLVMLGVESAVNIDGGGSSVAVYQGSIYIYLYLFIYMYIIYTHYICYLFVYNPLSHTIYVGNVVDEPTCKDTPEICERAVASITCVKSI